MDTDSPVSPVRPSPMTLDAAAAYLGLKPKTLYMWGAKKGPAYAKIGSRRWYRQSDLDAWIEAQRVEAPRAPTPPQRATYEERRNRMLAVQQ